MGSRLSEAEAEAYIGRRSFPAGRPRRIGVELEWLVRHADDPAAPVSSTLSEAAVAPLKSAGALPGGGRLTREPGGQVEISSRPASGLAASIADVAADLAALKTALAARGLVLDGSGLDRCREPVRILDDARYRAMEAYFDGDRAGAEMMCSSASIQLNLEAGEIAGVFGYRRRWNLAHRLGPVLVAAFANSPLRRGRPSGWKSTRQAVWARLDPCRTRPVPGEGDPRLTWTRYAMDARLLCRRGDRSGDWRPPEATFRDWTRGACAGPGPTEDDLAYHLGTLFPPVRPRGWLELRMVDAQHGDDWIVPVALCAMLFDDPVATAAAWEATDPLTGGQDRPEWTRWLQAARRGLADPVLHEAARACFAAAAEGLERTGAPAPARDAVAAFAARYVEPGRCPADDRLDTAPPSRALATDLEVSP